jgi:hypothetical protein
MSDYHLSLSIGKSLWDDLVGAALPVQIADGAFDLSKNVYQGVKQLGVRKRVSNLLEDKASSETVQKAKKRVSALWERKKPQLYHALNELIKVEGNWQIVIDQKGTDFHYSKQQVGVDAHVKAMVTGKALLLKENLELPFSIEKRLGASCHLGDIHFDTNQNAVVGSIQQPAIDLGEHVIMRILNDAIGKLLQQQTSRFNDVPLIKKDQLDEMVMPAGGPLKMHMNIEDVRIEVDDAELKLLVKFGFASKQLTGE